MDACSIIGESTDAIVMDDSPTDEREIQEACQRWVSFSRLWISVQLTVKLDQCRKITAVFTAVDVNVFFTLLWPM